jgi:CheY-like chemotaxis protein
MNSIIGFSNLLDNPDMKDETRQMYIQRIVRNSELLMALISDVIDLAKIESGQLSILYGKIKLSELISDLKQYALDELARLNIHGIEIFTEEERGDCELETDVIRLEQVMKNLINNAIKFTEKGSVKIGCKKAGSDHNIILFVQDTGMGIASEHFGLIFDQFRQIDGSNTRKFGGTGLGLTISRNLAQMMGGRIWVESESGKGALFQVELPLRSSFASESDRNRPTAQISAPVNHEHLNILVVEDEPDSLDLIGELLDSMGHHVSKADTGYAALKMLEQSSRPDLIFMDVQMPVLSGTETLKLIRDRYQGIKVVAQSAHALEGDRERFMNEGFDEYLPKPYNMEQLAGIISTLYKVS